MGIGENIRLLRKNKGVSLEFIAKKMGISRQTLSRYETGVITNIPSDKIEQIAKILNTTPSFLMGWSDNRYGNSENTISNKFVKIPVIDLKDIKNNKARSLFANEESNTAFIYEADDMIGARIFKGDIVIVKKTQNIKNSEIAALLLNGEIKLRRIYHHNTSIELKPEAPTYKPQILSKDAFNKIDILGKVVGFVGII